MTDSKLEPPSYEATLANNVVPIVPSNSMFQSQSLQARLTTARSQHIHTIIAIHILPLIQHRAERGLNKTSVALLPVNVTTSNPLASIDENNTTPKVVDIISSHNDDTDLQQVQLTDPTESIHFWSQSEILTELHQALKQTLDSSSELVKGQATPQIPLSTTQTEASAQQVPQPQSRSRSFFSRRSSSKGQTKGNTLPAIRDNAQPEPTNLPEEHVIISVQLEEICMRTQSAFGLYETLTRPAVLVRVHIRT